MSWDDLNNLPVDRVNDIQGAPVSVVGYLSIRVKEQTGAPGETTNCNLLNPDEVDWHMYLTNGPRQPVNTAIIVPDHSPGAPASQVDDAKAGSLRQPDETGSYQRLAPL